ncbi:MAG: DUF6603 domain-containing protein [Pseudomonadota bacterium]
MSTIATIIKAISNLPVADGKATITPETFDKIPFIQNVFSNLLGVQTLTFATAKTATDQGSATISGTVSLFGYADLACTLSFTVKDDKVTAKIDAKLDPTQNIQIPILTWLDAGTMTIATSVTEDVGLVDFALGLNLKVESGHIVPITLSRQSAHVWHLGVAEDPKQSVTTQDLVELVNGQALEAFLPSQVTTILEGIVLNDLSASFDVEQKILSDFTTSISVTNGWKIAPGVVELEPGMAINLALTTSVTKEPSDDDNTPPKETRALVAVGNLLATFKIVEVEVPISLGASVGGGTSIWTFGIQNGKSVTLPSFSGLLALAGGDDFLKTLPSGLAELPAIDVTKLIVEFDAEEKKLTELRFAMNTASTWPVIAGYFEIERLSVDFDITDLLDKTDRKVIGDIYAQFNVGNVPLSCEVKNTKDDQDWTVTAGLAPGASLNLTEVAAHLFDGLATLPDHLTPVVFNTLQVVVTPAKQSFSFEAVSDDGWPLLPNFDIEGLGINFSRTVEDKKPKLTGKISAKLGIAGIKLQLSAALNDGKSEGWSFVGEQLPDSPAIPIGKLIEDLASSFGPVALPSILTGLTVDGLKTTFNTKDKNFTFHCTLKDEAIEGLSLDVDIKIVPGSGTDYEKSFSGVATYKSDDVDLKFGLTFVAASKKGEKSTKTVVTYTAEEPPTLQQFLKMVSDDLGWDVNLPAGLNFDAALTDMTFEVEKKTDDPAKIDGAGQFDLTFGENKDHPWSFYLSYSNDTYFENQGKDSRAKDAKGKPAYVLGAAVSGVLDLSKLPLIGDLPGVGDFAIDKLGFYYTDAPFKGDDKKLIFSVAELESKSSLAPDPAAAFVEQPKFSLLALFGNQKDKSENQTPNAMQFGAATGAPPPNTKPDFSKSASVPEKPINWLKVNKSLGPVDIAKVGLSFKGPPDGAEGQLGVLGLYVSGGFSLAGVMLYLEGLGITFPLPAPGGHIKNPLDQVNFHLQGALLEFKQPGLEIAGGFISLSDDEVNMIGEFIVKIGPFGVSAYGGFAGDISNPSLFIFLHLDAPLGGPPFLFITGLSGGFGVNRGFTLPTFDELTTYPLLPTASAVPTAGQLGQTPEDKLKTMTNALLSLAHYFPVEEGEYWFAVGLDVTSFEMIDVSAILSIAFGNTLQFAIIGSAAMSLPNKVPNPIAYVQINFMISYSSSDDLLAVQGAITPSSYIFEGLVHLSGGFAFYTWLGGPHAGDFVLTIGGYSSHYDRPKNYPDVPRVAMRAGIGIVNMLGEAYFALVPSAIMAGISIKVTADLGPIKAWFFANADFFLGWKPFHYEIEVGISLGASFTIDLGFVKIAITIHVGVMLALWGPGFGGKATVDLDIISFTIGFGEQEQPAPTLNWEEFNAFLPSVGEDKKAPAPMAEAAFFATNTTAPPEKPKDTPKPLVNVSVKTGIIKTYTDEDRVDGLDWLLDANHFDIRTDSTAPSTALCFNGEDLPDTYAYFHPGDMAEQINAPEHAKQQAPYFIYAPPETGQLWYKQSYGIPPMGQQNIETTHVVSFYNYVSGVRGDVENDLNITLTTGNVPLSLWGNTPVSSSSPPPKDSVIPNALIGLQCTPKDRFPKRTTYIPYYYLVFNTNNLFLEQSVAPVLNTGKFDDAKVYEEMQSGLEFQNTEKPRAAVVDALVGAGFSNLKLENVGALSTQDYTADPTLVHMSSSASAASGTV